MIVVTPSVKYPDMYRARYAHGPGVLAACPLTAAWQAIVAARGGGA